MPTPASTVGALSLPAPVGATDAQLEDPAIAGLLDYFAFWVKWALDAKLATMTTPPVKTSAVYDACPVANRYSSDPSQLISSTFNTPALFVWCQTNKREPRTLVRDMRIRELRMIYVFPNLIGATQIEQWSGLMSTVDATLARACARKSHPGYSYGGSVLNESIMVMFSLLGITYEGSQEGFLRELVGASVRDAAERGSPGHNDSGGIQRGYPSLHARITIAEDILDDTLRDPEDMLNDSLVTLETGDTTSDTVPLINHYLVAPDGSDQSSDV